ncbi:MAG TPA: bifunctional YncE family protein/alkaline phosphatase family protein [Bryobacteraceae bacterium]|nr:bifunctional YncE family protein/alkaline phosphatase family protein [Bryobacteraceae bacterium]
MRPALASAIRIALALGCVTFVALLSSQPAPREQVGPLPGGAFLLNSGWVVDPAGKQIPLDTLPMNMALSPDGKYLVVLHGGYRPPCLTVIDAASGAVKGSVPVPDAWLGLTFSPRGDRVYVGGGSKSSVFEFAFADGRLTAARTFAVTPPEKLTDHDMIGDVVFAPDGHLLYATDLYHDSVVVINPQSGMVIDRIKTGRRPYRILFHPDGKSFFVTSWADGTLGHYDTSNGSQLARVALGAHPTDMVWRSGGPTDAVEGEPTWAARLFVAAANTNSVYSVAVTSGKELSVVERINVAMTPRQPLGMTPSALALSPDAKRLYVACSDGNVAAVVDVSGEHSHVEGFIPTGWYPTGVRALPSGGLVILNGKGVRSYANPNGPNPGKREALPHAAVREPGYVGYMQTGTASWIEPFTDQQLAGWTQRALANSAYRDSKLDEANTLPPIQHVLYIEKENRTYDQVLGDMKEGNGDASLVLFGEDVTPNLHKLAREFVLLDNFYVTADVSADGNNWSTAAISPDWVQKLWPSEYAGRHRLYDFEEGDPGALPPAGYIWTNAAAAGLSVRNYGFMVINKRDAAPTGADQLDDINDPVLRKATNRFYRGFDTNYPDVERAKTFLRDLAEFEKTDMPRLMVMRLPNDHTSGVSPGRLSPISQAADNDQAVGMIVEGISKSRFWSSTAICILEDDAQNGPDHVDSHRSPAWVISPYVKRHSVDSHMYNTTSMLRTIELVLGLHPMTHFDAGSQPMNAAFVAQPDAAPYALEKPRVPLDARNPPRAPALAENMKFDREDQNDDNELNEVLWRAIRKDAPPPPVRSYFGK